MKKSKLQQPTARNSSNGKVVIPAILRKNYPLKTGTEVVLQEERGRLMHEENDYKALYEFQGSLQEFPIEATLEAERRVDRERENDR